MTADEVLKQMQNSIYMQSNEQVYCAINPETRTIEIPDEYSLLGVESDEKAERIWFQCPKIVGDNIDLSKLQIRVNYQNSNNETDQYIVTDVQTEGNNIIFSWLLSRKVTAYQGNVSFIVCAVKVSGETIQNEWNTTLATAQVLEGLEVEEPAISEEELDVIAQLLQIMTETSEQAVNDVNTAKTQAISAVQAQQETSTEAIRNAGELIKESLPDDYVELSNKADVLDRTKAPAIIESASGKSIQLSDSADMPMHGINLYGKSEQVKTTGAQMIDFSESATDVSKNNCVVTDAEKGIVRSNIQGGYYCEINITNPDILEKVKQNIGKNLVFKVDDAKGKKLSIILYSGDRTVNKEANNTDSNNYVVNVIPEYEDFNSVSIRFNRALSAFTDTSTIFNGLMLYIADSAEDVNRPFEPYTGGKPSPSPEYPQEIKTSGEDGNIEIISNNKNLIDYKRIEKVRNYCETTLINDGFTLSGTWYAVIKDVRVEKDTDYVISYNASGDFNQIALYVSGKPYTIENKLFEGHSGIKFNTKENKLIDILFYAQAGENTGVSTYTNIQLEEASSATEYIPHKRSNAVFPILNGLSGIPVTSGGNYTDESGQQWVCDEIQADLVAGTGKYIQRCAKVTFDGSEDEVWNLYKSDNSHGAAVFSVGDDSFTIGNYKSICDKFINSPMSWDLKGEGYYADHTIVPLKYFNISADITNNVAGWRTWLQSNNVTLVYQLKSPVITNLATEQISALKQLRTYKGITNIMTDSDPNVGMNVEYAADTKMYIDNKINEVLQSLAATQNTLLQEV